MSGASVMIFFFFQAEDGIRDLTVTGVQTCALPISASSRTYCRPEKREGLKKTRATTSPVFGAAGNRRAGACADSRLHCLPEPHETQPSVVHPDTLPSVINHPERAHAPTARSGV